MWSSDNNVGPNVTEADAGVRDVQPQSSYSNPAHFGFSHEKDELDKEDEKDKKKMDPAEFERDRITNIPFAEHPQQERSMAMAFLLCFLLGPFGAHHFYLHQPMVGTVYACSLGVFGVGWIIDWFRVPFLVRECNAQIRESRERGSWLLDQKKYGLLQKRSLIDAYMMWMPYMGIFGKLSI